MELDKEFSAELVCPTNRITESFAGKMSSWGGVCRFCGHCSKSSVTHAVKISGKWKRPSIFEWLSGKRKYFIEGKGNVQCHHNNNPN